MDLNWLAEKANGFQGERMTVFLDRKKKRVGMDKAGSLRKGAEPLFSVFDKNVKKVPPPKAVDLTLSKDDLNGKKDETHRVLEEQPLSDALFWTPSAIEKFVIPYYVAHRLLTDAQLRKLQRGYRSGQIVAVLHVRPSIPFTYPSPAGGKTSESDYKVYSKKGLQMGTGPVDVLDYVKG